MAKQSGVFLQLPVQSSTPSANPPAGYEFVYTKSDGYLYKKTSAGVETQLSGTGTGGTVEEMVALDTDGQPYYDPTANTPLPAGMLVVTDEASIPAGTAAGTPILVTGTL